jgi:gas vesicle protein
LAVQFAGEVESVRSSLVLLERCTIDSLRLENEGLRGQIRKLYENRKEEMKKLESGIQLDMNLEKGRLREESTNLSQRIKDTHNRIETEVAQLKTQIESQKLELIKYLAGGIFSVVTIVLSVMLGLSRLLK